MNTEIKTELYTSPEAEVIEVAAQQVMCQSNTERLGDGTPGWDWE